MAIGGRFGGDLGFSSPAWLPGTRSEGEEEEFDWIAAMLWVQSFFLAVSLRDCNRLGVVP